MADVKSRRNVWIIVLVVVVLVLCACCSCAGIFLAWRKYGPGAQKVKTTVTPRPLQLPKAAEQPGKVAEGVMGQPVVTGSTLEWTVLSAKAEEELARPFGGPAKPDGVFLVIELKVKNLSDHTEMLTSGQIEVKDATGKTYDEDLEGTAALTMAQQPVLVAKRIEASDETTGQLVYDVPEDALDGLVLKVRGNLVTSKGAAEIRLDRVER